VLTVIQARTGSSRLPGKVLLPLGGRTALACQLGRVRAARLAGEVIVATTTDRADDPIVAEAARLGLAVFRGHPTDLLDRHYQAARRFGASHVVKIPSDCPLIDPEVIDRVIGWYLEQAPDLDFASNLHPASYPDGNDVEIMRHSALEAAWHEATRPHQREHTTPFIWEHPERFRLGNVLWAGGRDLSESHRYVLDYCEDYEVIREIDAALTGSDPGVGVDAIVAFLDANPAVMARNAAYRGMSWYRKHLEALNPPRQVAWTR
jgi:spore coat polysaccharide biosynthesis protein SpsF